MSITLVAGLGNPGRDYARTRPNLGWRVVDALACKHGLSWRSNAAFEAEVARWDVPGRPSVWLTKPLTFMNESGRSVGGMARYHKLPVDSVAVVHDDLTIDLGRLKVSVLGSAGGHNGVSSLLEHLGDGFARYRIGIGPKEPPQMDLKDFVLSEFTSEQLATIEHKLDSYVQGLELLIASGPDQAMTLLNRKDPT